jgi:hypothetical protein
VDEKRVATVDEEVDFPVSTPVSLPPALARRELQVVGTAPYEMSLLEATSGSLSLLVMFQEPARGRGPGELETVATGEPLRLVAGKRAWRLTTPSSLLTTAHTMNPFERWRLPDLVRSLTLLHR